MIYKEVSLKIEKPQGFGVQFQVSKANPDKTIILTGDIRIDCQQPDLLWIDRPLPLGGGRFASNTSRLEGPAINEEKISGIDVTKGGIERIDIFNPPITSFFWEKDEK